MFPLQNWKWDPDKWEDYCEKKAKEAAIGVIFIDTDGLNEKKDGSEDILNYFVLYNGIYSDCMSYASYGAARSVYSHE